MGPKYLGYLLPSIFALGLGAWLAGRRARGRFERKIEALFARVGRSAPADRVELPDLVRRFAERGVGEGAPAVVPLSVRLRQRCEMRFDPDKPWRQLEAEQKIAVGEPGFAWRAEERLGGFAVVRVVDAFTSGAGLLEARLLGSMPIVHAAGPETDRGELLRYLAELPWAPDAILHNPSLRWNVLDERTVEVSSALESASGGDPVRVRFLFEDGDVVAAEADERPRLEGSRVVGRPWGGRFWNYQVLGGRRVPLRGEVSWELDEGPFVYFRGEVVGYSLEYGADEKEKTAAPIPPRRSLSAQSV